MANGANPFGGGLSTNRPPGSGTKQRDRYSGVNGERMGRFPNSNISSRDIEARGIGRNPDAVKPNPLTTDRVLSALRKPVSKLAK